MSVEPDRSEFDVLRTEQLLQQVTDGGSDALERLLDTHRDYLRRLLEWQMEAELRGRIDPSDVIQETHLVAIRRIDEFLDTRPTSFKVWLRGKALDRLIEARRKHVDADMRSVRREIALPEASSLALAQAVASQSPSTMMRRRELVQQINQCVEELPELDREVLLLRHVEQLGNAEVAEVLEIPPKTASKRYGRALLKLRADLLRKGVWLGD